ncbi:MAG: hypothetical protein ACYDC6_05785 [Acidobacteriaceae bacterium]
MTKSAVPAATMVASRRWFFWLHADLLVALALLLFFAHWLARDLLIATFAGVFALMITGFFVFISGMADAGAALAAPIDKEASAWLVLLLAAVGVFLGIFLVVSPTISVERLCFFAAGHALAIGFLEVRLAQKLRRHQQTHKQKAETLRGFSAASTTFFLLLLMPVLYGERYGIFVLATYCLFFALELMGLPRKLRSPREELAD